MNRHHLITLLGGAMTARPLAARAQQKAMPVIGILLYGSKLSNQEHPLIIGLRKAELIDGKTATIMVREAEGRTERLAHLAAELVAAKPDVIVTAGPQPIRAVKESSRAAPVRRCET
jgi:putative ABC transport system substrate-binding protein